MILEGGPGYKLTFKKNCLFVRLNYGAATLLCYLVYLNAEPRRELMTSGNYESSDSTVLPET